VKKSNYFETARTKLLLNHPFFGYLACYLEEVDAKASGIDEVQTCATDGNRLYVNPDFMEKLTPGEQVFVLAHEIGHCALGHVWEERRGTRDKTKWNIAADYVVNVILKDEASRIANEPKNIYGQKGIQMEMAKGCLLDDKYKDMAVEEVYDQLPPVIKIPLPMLDLMEKLAAGKGSGKDDKSSGEGKVIVIGKGKDSDLERPPSEVWKERAVQAATIAKMQGKLPAGIERLIDNLVEPQIPWATILERFVNDSMKDDYDWMRRDRRFITRGIYLPDLYSEGANVAVAVDTSGSISQKELIEAVSETVGILRSKKIKSIRILACDADVHLDVTIKPHDDLPAEYPGSGGTDFRPVFEAMEKPNSVRPACLIYFTDTYGTFPNDPPPYPVLWITKTENFEPPFGMAIKIK
jgi:predicted metal-dependent peptidase